MQKLVKRERCEYVPPRITVLGTLADLTAGGDGTSEDDAYGFAGASGSN